jgi:DNA-binding response OmpR family regulator
LRRQDADPASVSVLIVDDNEDAAMSLTMLLELENISSAVAADAPAALSLLETIRPRLMLIDIGLPGMNGYELAQRVRERADAADATLIALSGREAEDSAAATVFHQFWTKPFDPKKLLTEVKAILSAAPDVTACARG